MTDRETTGKTSTASKPTQAGVSQDISQSFKNRSKRTKAVDAANTRVGTVSMSLAQPQMPSQLAPAASPRPRSHQPRRARLRVSRVDPWSVMKTALLFSVAAWIILIVATWIVFTVLDKTGLYDAINGTIANLFASPGATDTFNVKDYVNTTRATALAALIGAVNVVIMTALATIFAFLYNLSAVVMGGIEITMAED